MDLLYIHTVVLATANLSFFRRRPTLLQEPGAAESFFFVTVALPQNRTNQGSPANKRFSAALSGLPASARREPSPPVRHAGQPAQSPHLDTPTRDLCIIKKKRPANTRAVICSAQCGTRSSRHAALGNMRPLRGRASNVSPSRKPRLRNSSSGSCASSRPPSSFANSRKALGPAR